jgi:hypothetical protein
MRKFFGRAIFGICAAVFALCMATAGYAAEPDAEVKGLWLRIPNFPRDAEVTEFEADDDGEARYTRTIDGGLLTLGILRSPNPDGEITPELVKESIAESAGDKDNIAFDTMAEEISEMLSYPCVTAEYETGKDEDTKRVADVAVFTDGFVFVVRFEVAADSFGDYSGRTEGWLNNIQFVNGEQGGERSENDKADAGKEAEGELVAIAYTAPMFQGFAWEITEPDSYDLGKGFGLPNDSICSVRVKPGYKVTVYEHSEFGGESVDFDEDMPELGEVSRWASSLKVGQAGKADKSAVSEWVKEAAEARREYAELDTDEAGLAKALEKHAERVERFKGAGEMSWYGTTTDSERVALGGELLKIFGDCGADVSDWTPNSFAQQMNNFYDWRKDLSVWQTACSVLNLDTEVFEQ